MVLILQLLSYSILRKSIHWFNSSQRVENTEIMMIARSDLHARFRKKSIRWFNSPKWEENTETWWPYTPTFAPCFAKIDQLVQQQSTTGGKHTETHTPTFLPKDSTLVGTMAIKTFESWFDSRQGVFFSKASRPGQPTICYWVLFSRGSADRDVTVTSRL